MTDQEAWDLYFSLIVSWKGHPGYQRDGTAELTMEHAAKLADLALKMRQVKWPS